MNILDKKVLDEVSRECQTGGKFRDTGLSAVPRKYLNMVIETYRLQVLDIIEEEILNSKNCTGDGKVLYGMNKSLERVKLRLGGNGK